MMVGSSPWTDLFDQCCVDTTFAHTLYSYSSQFVISKGSHLLKFGGEQRLFYDNFFQPPIRQVFLASQTLSRRPLRTATRMRLAMRPVIRSRAFFLVTLTT